MHLRLAPLVLALSASFMTGCALESTAPPSVVDPGPLAGKIMGGQQPVAGAHVHVFAAGVLANAGNATAASSSNASTSLITSSTYSDSYGNYVPTDAFGNFALTGTYTCTAGQQVYLFVNSGNPGSGTNNPSLGLMSVLGQCPGASGFSSSVPYIVVNELTTVAAAYALAPFASDAVHISSDSGVTSNTTSAIASTGIANAFQTAHNLVDYLGYSHATVGNATYPAQLINTLGDILSSCVNSTGTVTGPTSPSTCYTLFNNALPAFTGGTAPTETATAAINIAHHPAVSAAVVSNLLGLQVASPPFLPNYTSGVNDFILAASYTGGGINTPQTVTNDLAGNIYTSNVNNNTDQISKFSPFGAALTSSSGWTLNGTTYVNGSRSAIDPVTGYLWVNDTNGYLHVVNTSTGAVIAHYTTATCAPYGIAFDTSNNVWISDYSCNGITSKISDTGTALTPTAGFSGDAYGRRIIADTNGDVFALNTSVPGAIRYPSGTTGSSTPINGENMNAINDFALDANHNLWLVGYYGQLYEFSGTGTALVGNNGYGTTSTYAIAVDGDNNIWTVGKNSLTESSQAGVIQSIPGGYTDLVDTPNGLIVDQSGNLWFAPTDQSNPVLVEYIGAAAPAVPLSYGPRFGKLGVRP